MEPTVSREQALALEHIESLAWRDLCAAATGADAAELALSAQEIAGGFAMAAGNTESLLQNRVLGLGLQQPIEEASLQAVLAHYPQGGSFAVNLCPYAQPGDAADTLARHGFATYFHHLKWVRDDSAVTSAQTSLVAVAIDAERASDWRKVYCSVHSLPDAYAMWASRAVGRPDWRHFLALDGDRPVAAAAMFQRDGLAWLGMMGTLRSHRRQGAQAALLAVRLRAGLEAGVRMFAMETGPDWPDLPRESLRNAARAGFHVAYERPSWVHGLQP